MKAEIEFPIVSAAVPCVRVAAGIAGRTQTVSEAPARLPERSLGLGPFSVEWAPSGLPQIVDASGTGWGIFANAQLAHQTAARLSR